MISKLSLGTVQFGLDYGIANEQGKISKEEAFHILDYAQKVGIHTLDTSMAYGDSEKVIGEYIAQRNVNVDVVTKILVDANGFDADDIKLTLQQSLQRLSIKKLDGCLLHRFDDFKESPQIWDVLKEAKKSGLIQKIGFSLYRPEELDLLWERGIDFDMVQIPYSIFDQRFEPSFERLKSEGVAIYARSIFLQGLVFLNPNQLTGNLVNAKEHLEKLHVIAKKNDISISALCLNFVVAHPLIDKVVIGVDRCEHLKNNINDLKMSDSVLVVNNDLKKLLIADENILLPFNWKAV